MNIHTIGSHKLPGCVSFEKPSTKTVSSRQTQAAIPITLVIASFRIGRNRVGVRHTKERIRTWTKESSGQKACTPSPSSTTMAMLKIEVQLSNQRHRHGDFHVSSCLPNSQQLNDKHPADKSSHAFIECRSSHVTICGCTRGTGIQTAGN